MRIRPSVYLSEERRGSLLYRGNSIRVMPLDGLPWLISRLTPSTGQIPVGRAVRQIRRTYLRPEQQVEFAESPR